MARAVPFVDCRGPGDSASHFKHIGEWALRGKYSPPGKTSCSFNSSLSQIYPFSLSLPIPPPSSSPVSSFTFWLFLNLSLFPALAFEHPVPEFTSSMSSQILYAFPQFILQCFLYIAFCILIPPFSPLYLSPLPFLSIFPDSSY